MLTSVNTSLAKTRGVKSSTVEYVFVVLVAITVMLSIRWVGVMLINSLLILPAAASRNVAKNAASYTRLSVIFAIFSGVVGLILSYYLNTSAGAAVVLVSAMIYFVTLLLVKR